MNTRDVGRGVRLRLALDLGLVKLHVLALDEVAVALLVLFVHGDPRVVDENVLVVVRDEPEPSLVVVPFDPSNCSAHVTYIVIGCFIMFF